MGGAKRTLADWIWTLVGIAGVACIGIAAWLFFVGGEKTPEEQMKARLAEAREFWQAGTGKLEAGENGAALADLEKAVSLIPDPRMVRDYHVVQNDLGRAYLANGKAEQAAVCWITALKLSPGYAPPYLNLAKVYEEKKNDGLAYQFYRAALALHPEPVPADLPGKVSEIDGKLSAERDRELADIRKDLLANPASIDAFAALVLWKVTATKVEEDAKPSEALRRAIVLVGAELVGLDELLTRQESAVSDRPESVVDRAGLGFVRLLRGEWAEAREVFDAALGISSGDPASQLGASISDLLTGAEDTKRMEQAALRLKGNPLGWMVLGASSLEHDKLDVARAALFRALQISPALPEVYRLLGQAFAGDEYEEKRAAALRAYARLLE